jgi:hypothetical protein
LSLAPPHFAKPITIIARFSPVNSSKFLSKLSFAFPELQSHLVAVSMPSLSAYLRTHLAIFSPFTSINIILPALNFQSHETASPRPSRQPLQSSHLRSPTSPHRGRLLCMLVHVLDRIAERSTPDQSLPFVPSQPKLPRVPAQSHTYRLARPYTDASANSDVIRANIHVSNRAYVCNPKAQAIYPSTLLPFHPS